jgi:hypothetical protein
MIEPHDSPETSSGQRQPGGTASEKEERERIQKQLDDALADSFPASDPVSIVTSHQEDWDSPETEPESSKPESE